MQSDPINLSTRFIAALGEYVSTRVEQVAVLVARFFSLFMRDSQHLETYEVDNFVLRNASVLGAWCVTVAIEVPCKTVLIYFD